MYISTLYLTISDIHGWLDILIKGGFKQIQEIENVADIWADIVSEAKKEYHRRRVYVKQSENEFIKEFENNHKEEVKIWKSSYLKRRILILENQLLEIEDSYREMVKTNVPYWLREAIYDLNDTPRIQRELKNLIFRLRLIENNSQMKKGGVTEQDIVMARERNIKDFIKEVSPGLARSPFRKDIHPSFGIKGNRYYDFATGERGDIISLMQKIWGTNFVETVKRLNNS